MSCIDVIVCKRKDGSLKSSPFFVRFSNRNELPHLQSLHIKLNGSLVAMKNYKLVLRSGEKFAFFQKRHPSRGQPKPTSSNTSLSSQTEDKQESLLGKKNVNSKEESQEKDSSNVQHHDEPETVPVITFTDPESEDNTIVRDDIEVKSVSERYGNKNDWKEKRDTTRPYHSDSESTNTKSTAVVRKPTNKNDNPDQNRSPLGNAMYNVYERMRERWLHTIDSLKLPEEFTTPPDELLQRLDLSKEVNNVSFVSKEEILHGRIFVWDEDCKIVVSDIDGTITKSDIVGQLATRLLGMQYTHPGVATLFHNISEKGYKFVYVTVRSISQSNFTKDYLVRVREGKTSLPLGPVILPPVAGSSIVRWRMPTEFKVPILSRIKELWPRNPFVAGWGNRETDALAYISVGIDPAKCWIIHGNGEVVAHDGGLNLKHKHRRFASYSYLAENWRHLQLTEDEVKEKEHVVADIESKTDLERLSDSFVPAPETE